MKVSELQLKNDALVDELSSLKGENEELKQILE